MSSLEGLEKLTQMIQANDRGAIQTLIQDHKGKIAQLDDRIQVICTKHCQEFMQTIQTAERFQGGISDLKENLIKVQEYMERIQGDYLSKASRVRDIVAQTEQIKAALRLLALARTFIDRIHRSQQRLEQGALQGVMRETMRIAQDLSVSTNLPEEFRQYVSEQIRQLSGGIMTKLYEMQEKVVSELDELEEAAGTQCLDTTSQSLRQLSHQFILEPEEQYSTKQESKVFSSMQKPKTANQYATYNSNLYRSIRTMGNFLDDMEDAQLIEGDDSVDEGEHYSAEAIQRQRNYANEMAIKIDYLSIDRLDKFYTLALEFKLKQEYDFKQYIFEKRFERLQLLCKQFEDASNSSVFEEKHFVSLTGFFQVQQSLTFNLSHVFEKKQLFQLWNMAVFSVQKSFEQSLHNTEFSQMMSLKRAALLYGLCAQDQGLCSTNDEICIQHALVRNVDTFLNKQSEIIKEHVRVFLENEDYEPLHLQTDDQYNYYVRKFDFDSFDGDAIGGLATRSNVVGNFAAKKDSSFQLPFSKSVAYINRYLEEQLDMLLDYWQYLVGAASDLVAVNESCDRLLNSANIAIEEHIAENVITRQKVPQQAQVCMDLDFFMRSTPFFKKVIRRRAVVGLAQLSAKEYNALFQLKINSRFLETKQALESVISQRLLASADEIIKEMQQDVTWNPKRPHPGGQAHSHTKEFCVWLENAVLPLYARNPTLIQAKTSELIKSFRQALLWQAATGKLNQAGLTNLMFDYTALQTFIQTQQLKGSLVHVELLSANSKPESINLREEWLKPLKVLLDYFFDRKRDGFSVFRYVQEQLGESQETLQLIHNMLEHYKEERFVDAKATEFGSQLLNEKLEGLVVRARDFKEDKQALKKMFKT